MAYNRYYVFKAMYEHIRITNINSVHKPLLLILIFRDKIIYIDSTILLPTATIVLQSIRMAEPLLDFMLVEIKICFLFVDFVEIRLAGRHIDEFIDIVGFVDKIVHRATLDIFQQFKIIT